MIVPSPAADTSGRAREAISAWRTGWSERALPSFHARLTSAAKPPEDTESARTGAPAKHPLRHWDVWKGFYVLCASTISERRGGSHAFADHMIGSVRAIANGREATHPMS